jgi:hypothetical protein
VKKKVITKPKELVIYQTKSGALELRGDKAYETVWATQAQIAQVFEVNRSVVTKHIRNILADKEISEKSNVQKMHIANSDKPVAFYSLDIILAVGYRTNSAKAIVFRQWATKTLKSYLIKGYVLNPKAILARNYEEFLKNISVIQDLLPEHVALDPKSILELVKEFASTWTSLDAYDKESLKPIGATKKSVKFSADELSTAIMSLRTELIRKGEATEIFAQERKAGSIEGIVGNVMQSFGGTPVYKTLEEKAAHLLYFMVKNHPFTDGNKRSGAFAFVWFVRKVRLANARAINPASLTALTLLIAESHPNKKEQMIGLVTTLLSSKKN